MSSRAYTSLLCLCLYCSFCKVLTSQCTNPYSSNTNSASTIENASFELINRFRADPKGELARIINDLTGNNYTQSSLSTLLNNAPNPLPANWWKNTFNGGSGSSIVFNSMDFYGTVPSVLQSQWDALASPGSLYPIVWQDNMGWSSLQYATCVENDAGNTQNYHNIPGAPTFGNRFTQSGYASWNTIGENIAPNWTTSAESMHAGFAIDWGQAPNGIQSPPGHRNAMLSSNYTEIGIGIVDAGWTTGKVSQVQHFARQSSDTYLSGYVYLNPATSYSFTNAAVGIPVTLKNSAGIVLSTFSSGQYGEYFFDMTGLANGTYTLEVPGGGPCGGNSGNTSYSVSYIGSYTLLVNIAANSSSGNLNLTGIQQSSEDYEANGIVISSQTIQTNPNNPTGNVSVDYDSADKVRLMPGFKVLTGPVFRAFIDGCGGSL